MKIVLLEKLNLFNLTKEVKEWSLLPFDAIDTLF